MMERTRVLRAILFFVAISVSAVAQIAVTSVGPIGMTVSDADKSIAFYTTVLQFQKVSDQEFAGAELEQAKGVFGARARIVRMRLGTEEIELAQYLAPEGRPFPIRTRGNDRWFQHVAIIVRDMDQAYAILRKHNVRHASSGPQTLPAWNKNAGGIKAFYFRDPDGHFLELLEFPPDKGLAKWHTPGNDLFIGIDHTAITVADTEASLRFYQQLLGLKVVGASENYGTEQEHLNNVFGARLRITALRAASGPGIELLEYLAPRDGASFPADSQANDLLHWEMRLVVNSAEQSFALAQKEKLVLISAAPAAFEGQRAEFQLKDPDGHAVVLTEAGNNE